jgi:hypothetical protein
MAIRWASAGTSTTLGFTNQRNGYQRHCGGFLNIRFQQRRDTSDRFYPAPSKQDFYFLGLYEAGFLNAHQTTGDFAL